MKLMKTDAALEVASKVHYHPEIPEWETEIGWILFSFHRSQHFYIFSPVYVLTNRQCKY